MEGDVLKEVINKIPGDQVRARNSRVDQYLNESLQLRNSLEANIGVINAGLIRIAHGFQDALDPTFRQPQENASENVDVLTDIDSFLRIVKQIDRFSHLAMKLKREDRDA